MTAPFGALSLKITAEGAERVDQQLRQIDAEARALGAKPVVIPVSGAPVATAAAQVNGLTIGLREAAVAAAGTATGLEGVAAAGAGMATAAAETGALATALSSALPLAIVAGVGLLISKFREAHDAEREAENALDDYLAKLRKVSPESEAIDRMVAATRRLTDAERQLAAARAAADEEDNAQARKRRAEQLLSDSERLNQAQRSAAQAGRDASNARAREQRLVNEELNQAADALGRFQREGVATADERATIERRLVQYRKELLTLTATDDETTRHRLELLDRIDALTQKEQKTKKEHVETEDDILARLGQEVNALQQLDKLRLTNFQTAGEAVRLEQAISHELQKQLTLIQRAEAERAAATLRRTASLELAKGLTAPDVRDLTPSLEKPIPVKKFDAAAIKKQIATTLDPVEVALAKKKEEFQLIGQQLAIAIAGGLASGFAKGGFSEALREGLAAGLSALGTVAIQYGAAAIKIGSLIAKIQSFALKHPLLAIAAGVALVALGNRLHGQGGGLSSGGIGSGLGTSNGTPEAIRLLISDPSSTIGPQRVSGTGSIFGGATRLASGSDIRVIGIDSAEGQRLIGTANARFVRRGGS